MGFTFVYELNSETGASICDIYHAYTITRNIFGLAKFWGDVEKLDYKVKAEVQLEMMHRTSLLVRRATRWFLRNRKMALNITVL